MESNADAEQNGVTANFTSIQAYAFCAFVDGDSTTLPASWQPAWVPEADVKGHTATVFQLFAASHAPLPVFALAIQGTKDILDLLSDFEIYDQPSFPPIAGAKIAKGSQGGLGDILALRSSKGSGQTLQEFLMDLVPGSQLLLTGHSLGGNVASVLAPWIAANVPAFGGQEGGKVITGLPGSLTTITFAAPTAGNEAFASFLNGQPNYQAYFNTNDVVPHVWAASGPWSAYDIEKLFPAPGPNPAPEEVSKVINTRMKVLSDLRVSYTQTNGTSFTFQTVAAPGDNPWVWEVGYQHNYAYCMKFQGSNCKPSPSGS
jgi:triacylglycerol lipase